MPKNKKKHDIQVNLTYQHEQDIARAEVVDASALMPVQVDNINVHFQTPDGLEYSRTYYSNDYGKSKGFGPEELKQIYSESGNSAEAAFNGLVNYFRENKDNPDAIRITAQKMAKFGSKFYDNSQYRGGVADSPALALEKWLTVDRPNAQIKGNICGEIHGIVASALREAKVPATLIAGKGAKGEEHVALIYENTDGNYVFNDYGTSISLKAKSILDAVDEVAAGSDDFDLVGWYTFEDGGHVSFQKFAYSRENAYGETIDKTAYNSDLPSAPQIDDNGSVSANATISDVGNAGLSVAVTSVSNRPNSSSQTTFGLEARLTRNSNLFHSNAYSAGGMYKHDTLKHNGWYHKTSATLSYLTGKVGGQEYHNATSQTELSQIMCNAANKDLIDAGFPDKATYTPKTYNENTFNSYSTLNNITASAQHFTGKENTILKTDKTTITNTAQAGVIAGITTSTNNLSINGDARIILEDGLSINTAHSSTLSSTFGVSAGVAGDLKISHVGFPVRLQPAGCFKGTAGVSYKQGNINCNANIGGYYYRTSPTIENGLSASLSASYTPSKKVSFKGSVFAKKELQQLKMNLFDERITNKTTLGASLTTDLKNSSIEISAIVAKDNINPTKNVTSVTASYRLHF